MSSNHDPPRRRGLFDHLIPELEAFPSETERRAAVKRAGRRLLRTRRFWRRVSLAAIPAILVVTSVSLSLQHVARISPAGVSGLTGGLFGGIIGLLIGRISRPQVRAYLREYLAELGIPVCAACGYNLTGNTTAQCPECGRPISAAKSDAIE